MFLLSLAERELSLRSRAQGCFLPAEKDLPCFLVLLVADV